MRRVLEACGELVVLVVAGVLIFGGVAAALLGLAAVNANGAGTSWLVLAAGAGAVALGWWMVKNRPV